VQCIKILVLEFKG